MRLLATADIHFNHPRSRPLAEAMIAEMNTAGGDVLLVIGDTAAADGDAFEKALGLFKFAGPKLIVAGNHELWTRGNDSYQVFRKELPARAAALGWQWLQDEPFVRDDIAIVGSIGWYDYSFAEPGLGIPRRYYEAKVAPGVSRRLSEYSHLIQGDESPQALEIFARWNDGRFVKLGMSDDAFLDGLLEKLSSQLESLRCIGQVIAGIHHVPFAELLPPRHTSQWDFARAFLGGRRIGELLRRYGNISHVICGHSHHAAEARIGSIRAINIGSGYRAKKWVALDVP